MCRYYCAIFVVLVQPQSIDWNLEHIIGLTEFDEGRTVADAGRSSR